MSGNHPFPTNRFANVREIPDSQEDEEDEEVVDEQQQQSGQSPLQPRTPTVSTTAGQSSMPAHNLPQPSTPSPTTRASTFVFQSSSQPSAPSDLPTSALPLQPSASKSSPATGTPLANPPPNSSNDGSQSPSEDEGDHIWHCICTSAYSPGEEAVQCDKCQTWMHTECANYHSNDPDDIFLCHVCDPVNFYANLDTGRDKPASADPEEEFSDTEIVEDVTTEAKDDLLSVQASSEDSDDVPLVRKFHQKATKKLVSLDDEKSGDVAEKPKRKSTTKAKSTKVAVKRKTTAAAVVDTSDNGEILAAPTPPRKRPARKSKAKTRESGSPEPTAEDEQDFSAYESVPLRQLLEQMDIETNSKMVNLQKWNKTIGKDGNGLKLTKIVKPTVIRGRIVLIRDLLDEPVVDGRNHEVVKVVVGEKAKWIFTIRDANNSAPDVEFSSDPVSKVLLPTTDDAVRWGKVLCQFLDHLPMPPGVIRRKKGRKEHITAAVKVAILALTHSDQDWSNFNNLTAKSEINAISALYNPGVHEPKLTSRVTTFCNSGEDGAFVDHPLTIGITLDKLLFDVEIPDITSFERSVGYKAFETEAVLSEKIPADLRPKFQYAIRLTRYVQVNLYGAIGTVEELKAEKENLLAPFMKDIRHDYQPLTGRGLKRRYRYGPYGHKRFYALTFHPQPYASSNLRPSAAVNQTVNKQMPPCSIHGDTRTHLSFQVERMAQALYHGANIIQVFQLGYMTADYLNAGLITSTEIKRVYCECKDDVTRRSTIHVCQICLGRDVCSRMTVDHRDLRICHEDHPNDDGTGFVQAPLLAGMGVAHRVRSTLAHDKSVPDHAKHQLGEDVLAHLKANYREIEEDGSWTWKDVWINAQRPDVSPRGKPGPFVASFEGLLPVASIEGSVVYHGHPLQCGITAVVWNRMERQHIPAYVPLVSLSQPRAMADNGKRGLYDQEKLNRQLDHLCLVESTYKWGSKESRVSMTNAKVEDLNASWTRPVVQGKVTKKQTLEIAWNSLYHSATTNSKYRWWKPRSIASIAAIVDQAEQKYGFEVSRGTDGAPFPFRPDHMPSDWQWDDLWRFWSGRLFRMEFTCNVKDETVDDVERLLLECLVQFIMRKGKDDFFKLCITLFVKHAQLSSIGHKRHGRQMVTGFHHSHPKSLDEWDEQRSNILFETQSSNMAKWDYNEETCQAVLDDISHARLETEYYAVPNDCQKVNVRQILERASSRKVEDNIDDVYESENEIGRLDDDDDE